MGELPSTCIRSRVGPSHWNVIGTGESALLIVTRDHRSELAMNMTTNTQLPPDLLSMQTESELICEKLLGWDKARVRGDGTVERWHIGTGSNYRSSATPCFTTWADAGLILDAWIAAGNDYDIEGTVTETRNAMSARLRQIKGISYVGDFGGDSETAPLAIRAAALRYIGSLS